LRTQVQCSCPSYRRARVLLAVVPALFLSGCWVPPSAGVRPHGKPRLIADGIDVERVVDSARVESLDRAARTVVLSVRGIPLPACKVGWSVHAWDEIRPGDEVRATIKEVLTLYVAAANEGSGPGVGTRSLRPDARVLVADPSYRLLTIQYPSGQTAAFKVGLHTRMNDIEAGDAVVIRRMEAVELRVRRHLNREQGSRSSQSSASAR
jgi:hypothetical protein